MQNFRRLHPRIRQRIKFNWLPIFPILAAFIILSIIYAWATPPFEASDELWHFGVIQHIADTGQLPVQRIGVETGWEQEGSQPPLYYLIAALLVKPIDRSDFEAVTQPNPHAQTGIPGFVGNKNLVLHDSPHPPLRGTVLAVYVVRAFSILLGCVTVFAVYAVVMNFVPNLLVAILAAGIAAFNPMFLFITGSVNNDNLVTALNSLILWLILIFLSEGFSLRRSVIFGVLLSLSSLTKISGLVMFAPVGLAALWVAYRPTIEYRITGKPARKFDWRGLLSFGMIVAGVWLLLAGWWYLRNLNLYGEILGTRTMAAVAGVREEPFTLNTLVSEYQGFRFAYWALFGGVNIMTYRWFYDVMDIITIIALMGIIIVMKNDVERIRLKTFFIERSISFSTFIRTIILGITILLGFSGIITWTAQTYASQGRLLFPFVAAIAPLMSLGLSAFWSTFLRQFFPFRKRLTYVDLYWWPPNTLVAFLAIFALIVPFASIAPQYAPPAPLNALPESAQPVYARFGEVALVGYETPEQRYQPGDQVPITVYWQVIESSDRDNSLFLHAINPVGDVIGKVDSYPGAGRLRTSTWEAGAIYPDTYAVPLDGDVEGYYPLRLQVGWWHFPTQEYISAVGQDNQPIEAVVLNAGAFAGGENDPLPQDLTPASADFGGTIRLLGYKLDGDQLTLAWESLAPLPDDYRVFVQVLESSKAIVGQGDAPPSMPTRYWLPGERYITQHSIAYTQELTTGEYPLVIGWYNLPNFNRLSIAHPDNAYPLTTITVE